MNHLRFLILSLFFICCSSWADAQNKQVTAVENGLLPVNVFKGDQPWALKERMEHYGVPGVGIAVNTIKAIEHYRNALKRDPKFASALKGLAELE